jgi:hypothetical protein
MLVYQRVNTISALACGKPNVSQIYHVGMVVKSHPGFWGFALGMVDPGKPASQQHWQ